MKSSVSKETFALSPVDEWSPLRAWLAPPSWQYDGPFAPMRASYFDNYRKTAVDAPLVGQTMVSWGPRSTSPDRQQLRLSGIRGTMAGKTVWINQPLWPKSFQPRVRRVLRVTNSYGTYWVRQRPWLSPIIERADGSLLARYRFSVFGQGLIDSTARADEVALVVVLWSSRLLLESCWISPIDVVASSPD
jgi:hypothetical protein